MEGFSFPVCTSFEATLFMGQHCYSIDVNKFIAQNNLSVKSGSQNGLSLLIDENSERHFGYFEEESNKQGQEYFGSQEENQNRLKVYIETIEPYEVTGGGHLALTAVKRIVGTEEYFDFATKNNLCQNKETLTNCSATDLSLRLLQECRCIPFELFKLVRVGSLQNLSFSICLDL